MSGIKDDNLFRLFFEFIEKIFSIPNLAGIDIPHQEFIGYTSFKYNLEESLRNDLHYKAIINYMKDNEVYSKHIDCLVGVSYYGTRQTCWDYIFYLINEQLYFNNGKFLLDNEKLLNDYKMLENFFYNDKIAMRASLRLINFKMEDIEEIDLGNNTKIKRMEERDQSMFIDQRYTHPQSQFIIDIIYEEEKILHPADGIRDTRKLSIDSYLKAQDSLHHVINFLRLFKEGDIKAGGIYRTALHNVILIGSYQMSSISSSVMFLNTYTVTTSELDNLKLNWDVYKKLDVTKYKEFSSSLRRLGYAMERYRYDDRLVDLVIAIESLFYRSGERTELTYRIRLRLSKLLEENIEERVKLARKMSDIYGVRSSIIHGGEYKITKDIELVKECEKILRQALTKYLVYRKEMPHDSLMDKLDYA